MINIIIIVKPGSSQYSRFKYLTATFPTSWFSLWNAFKNICEMVATIAFLSLKFVN